MVVGVMINLPAICFNIEFGASELQDYIFTNSFELKMEKSII